jgi:hypothetical protein
MELMLDLVATSKEEIPCVQAHENNLLSVNCSSHRSIPSVYHFCLCAALPIVVVWGVSSLPASYLMVPFSL